MTWIDVAYHHPFYLVLGTVGVCWVVFTGSAAIIRAFWGRP